MYSGGSGLTVSVAGPCSHFDATIEQPLCAYTYTHMIFYICSMLMYATSSMRTHTLHVYTYIYIYIHMYVRMYVCMYVNYVYTYIYMYMYIHMNMYMYMYTCVWARKNTEIGQCSCWQYSKHSRRKDRKIKTELLHMLNIGASIATVGFRVESSGLGFFIQVVLRNPKENHWQVFIQAPTLS